MVVGSVGDYLVAALDHGFSHDGCVFAHLDLIVAELRLKRFMESDGLCGDDMFERSALNAGEHCRIEQRGHHAHFAFGRLLAERIGEVFAHQYDSSAGAAQGLVGGGGHDVGIFHRVVKKSGCNKTGRMSHVNHEYRSDLIGQTAHAGIVPVT